MPKFALLSTALGTVVSAGSLRPASFAWDDVAGAAAGADRLDRHAFADALARRGFLAVDMGADFEGLRSGALAAAARCMDATGLEVSVMMPDGTARRTLAAESNVEGRDELSSIFTSSGAALATDECEQFKRLATEFRKRVGEVASALGRHIAGVSESAAVAAPPAHHRPSNGTLAAFQRGPRLEHFHSYHQTAASQVEARARALKSRTLDFHVDQGLFVLFSPGADLHGAASGRLQVRAANEQGSWEAHDLDFGPKPGQLLVAMLGDAVRQLGIERAEELFHVPSHAFQMPEGDDAVRRLWYGLMQLPPPTLVAQNVVDPTTGERLTFGAIRERVASPGGATIGCSSLPQWAERSGLERRLEPRLLETCTESQISCWHRCMEKSTADETPQQCMDRGDGHMIKCVNQDGVLWENSAMDHSDQTFKATCSNLTATGGDGNGGGSGGSGDMGGDTTTGSGGSGEMGGDTTTSAQVSLGVAAGGAPCATAAAAALLLSL